METFKIVAKIKYKENYYFVFVNKKCQKYFIKEFEDGSIMYPTLQEYKELNEIFNKKQSLASLKIGNNYEIDPKVIKKGGKLVTLGVLVASLGIMVPQPMVSSDFENYYFGINNNYGVEETYRRIGYDFHSLYGYEDERLYRVHRYILSAEKKRIIECQDFEEFSHYIGTKANPSFSDVRETIRKNNNIDARYKSWLLEGIDNLEKNLPYINLTVLNYNLDRLVLERTTKEELNKNETEDIIAGKFDPETGKAYLVDVGETNSNKFVLYHEVLGHGISEASFERDVNDNQLSFNEKSNSFIQINKEKIVVSDSIFVARFYETLNNDVNSCEFFYLGQGLEEGKADQIARMASGNTNVIGTPYIEQTEQLRIMSEAFGLDFNSYISKGGAESLNKKLKQNYIENSLNYIQASDIAVSAMKSNNVNLIDKDDTFKSIIISFFKDYAKARIKSGETKKEVVNRFAKILANGGRSHIQSTFTGENIDYAELAEEIKKDDLENIDGQVK